MRKILLLLLCVTVTLLAYANPITPEEAKNKAEAFMKARHATGKRHVMRLAKKSQQQSTAQTAAYYVFNADAQEGFVVVSGDDRTPAILGFSDSGTFDANNIPSNMQAWLDEYERQLDYLETHPTTPIAKAPANDYHAISPMLTTMWNQGDPYNMLCPMDSDELSVTGCAATALAQVLYYHKYPAKTIAGIPAYVTKSKGFQIDSIPPTDIDWAHMLDRYTGNETQQQKLAVATLMKLCGAAFEMNYSSDGSGASGSKGATILKKYFDYDAATYYAYRTDYRAKDWGEMVYNELANNRPVYYTGQSTGGGHGFVIDGYDSDGMFHVNWGWGGNRNGYFLLSILDPHDNSGIGASSSTDGYSFNQGAIFGAQPNTGITPVDVKKMTTTKMLLDKTTFYKAETDSFSIDFKYAMYNRTGDSCAFNLGVGVYNTDNELVYKECWDYCYELKNRYGWKEINMIFDIPALSDGYYIVVPICREYGTETWYPNDGSKNYNLTAHIMGDSLVLMLPTVDLSCDMQAEDGEVGKELQVTTTITNNGTFFNDILFLYVNDKEAGGRHFDIEAGDTSTLTMSFTPEEAGTYEIALGHYVWEYDEEYDDWDEVIEMLASTTVTVVPAKSHSLTFSDGIVTNANSQKVINNDYADIVLNVKNTGTNDYNEDILTWVWKEDADSYTYHQRVYTPVNIPAGASQPVDIHIGNLDNGAYWFIMVYKNEGEYTDYNDKLRCYRKLSGYTVIVPESGISTLTPSLSNGEAVIYDLQGRKVLNPRQGLFIVNGRLVIK